jgi:hypothetical protein
MDMRLEGEKDGRCRHRNPRRGGLQNHLRHGLPGVEDDDPNPVGSSDGHTPQAPGEATANRHRSHFASLKWERTRRLGLASSRAGVGQMSTLCGDHVGRSHGGPESVPAGLTPLPHGGQGDEQEAVVAEFVGRAIRFVTAVLLRPFVLEF